MDLNRDMATNFPGAAGTMESQPLGFPIVSSTLGPEQGMHLQQPVINGSPQLQGHYPQLNMMYPHPMMHQAGQFSGPFVPTPTRFAPCNQPGGAAIEVEQCTMQAEQHHARQEAPRSGGVEEDDLQEVPPTTYQQAATKKKGACRRGKGYEPDEDRVLVSGWLNISKDATVGTNQDKAGFYKRLRQYYMDNYDPNTKRSENSIQQRWSTIQTRVSKFCAILSRIERLNQSGKSYQDMVNEAIRTFQETEPWHYQHCWEMLRDEPKWNDKLLEIQQAANKGKDNQADSTDTATQSEHDISSMPPRPEGRDQAKKRKATRMGETSSSSVAVDMLKKMHDKGQEMDEIDAKHKEELISLERTKIELQQKQLEVQCDMQKESNKLKKEICQEKLQLQREMNQAKLKVQENAVEVERQKNDTEIMFADLTKMRAGLRAWVLKRQMDIMIRDGVDPALAAATDDSP